MDERMLTHEELYDPRGPNRFLSPRSIPIHPDVYESTFAYQLGFISEVRRKLHDSVNEDVDAHNRIFGTDLDFRKLDIDRFDFVVSFDPKSVDLYFVSAGIALQPDSHIERIMEDYELPPQMNDNRLKLFSRSKEELEIYSWYTHTPGTSGLDTFLYLRNFAIQFNNVGIKRLK